MLKFALRSIRLGTGYAVDWSGDCRHVDGGRGRSVFCRREGHGV